MFLAHCCKEVSPSRAPRERAQRENRPGAKPRCIGVTVWVILGGLAWACGAAGSAPEWHSGGHRFDPGQVHQPSLLIQAKVARRSGAAAKAGPTLSPNELRLAGPLPSPHRTTRGFQNLPRQPGGGSAVSFLDRTPGEWFPLGVEPLRSADALRHGADLALPQTFVYVLKCKADPTRYYTGLTSNLERRPMPTMRGAYRTPSDTGRG